MRSTHALIVVIAAGLLTGGLFAAAPDQSSESPPVMDLPHDAPTQPVPRWRESGTPYNPDQSRHGRAIPCPDLRDAPITGDIASQGEWGPTRGVLFWYSSYAWPEFVVDLVANLTGDPDHDEIAYVAVPSVSQQTDAAGRFAAAGADMSRVQFYIAPANALWMRDYGPNFIFQDGALGIVDSQYFITRPLDNFMPTLLGDDHLIMPTYDMGLSYAGGNLQPGPDSSAFMSSLIHLDNPPSEGFDDDLIAELFGTYQGFETLHILPQLPFDVDMTGHIDMWMYLVDEDSVIISEFKPGSDATAIEITDNAVPYMEALGFEVHRPPAFNDFHPSYGDSHFTYTNAFRANDRIFIPAYGHGKPDYLDEDAEALAAWEAAAGPDVEIIPIQAYDIIWAGGAMHCIVKQVPRCTDEVPAVHVISPCGGELLVPGTTHEIIWVASDMDNIEIPQIDLYYSLDAGDTYDYIATTTDTGAYLWTVPAITSDEALIKVIATSSDSDTGEAVSAGTFRIAEAQQHVYDFATDAGVDRQALGYQTGNWYAIDGDRTPVTTPVDSLVDDAYDKLAYSDATAGDYDPNRYVAPDPTIGQESTHIFEFDIAQDPSTIDEIAVHWEGYADRCILTEIYIWDYVDGNWGDGSGLFGQNRFMDCWAGNRDGFLGGAIRSDFDRFFDADNPLTVLVYAEQGSVQYGGTYSVPTFHDYMSVTVTHMESTCPADVTGDDIVDVLDLLAVLSAWGETGGLPEDINGDGVVDVLDLLEVLTAWGPC